MKQIIFSAFIILLPVSVCGQNEKFKLRLITTTGYGDYKDDVRVRPSVYDFSGKGIGIRSFPDNSRKASVLIDSNKDTLALYPSRVKIDVEGESAFEAEIMGKPFMSNDRKTLFSSGGLTYGPESITDQFEAHRYILSYSNTGQLKFVKGPFNLRTEPLTIDNNTNLYLAGTVKRSDGVKKLLIKINEYGEIEWEENIKDPSGCTIPVDIKISNDDKEIILIEKYFEGHEEVYNNRLQFVPTIDGLSSSGRMRLRIISTITGEIRSINTVFVGGSSDSKVRFASKNKIIITTGKKIGIISRSSSGEFLGSNSFFSGHLISNIAISPDGMFAAFVMPETKELQLVELAQESFNNDIENWKSLKILSKVVINEKNNNERPSQFRLDFKDDRKIEVCGYDRVYEYKY